MLPTPTYTLPPHPDDPDPSGLGRRYRAGLQSLLDRAWCPVRVALVGWYLDPHAESYAWLDRAAIDAVLRLELGDAPDVERPDGTRVAGATLYAVAHQTVGGRVVWYPLSCPPEAAPHVTYGRTACYAPADVLQGCISTLTVRSRAGDEVTVYYLADEDADRLLWHQALPTLAAAAAHVAPDGLLTHAPPDA